MFLRDILRVPPDQQKTQETNRFPDALALSVPYDRVLYVDLAMAVGDCTSLATPFVFAFSTNGEDRLLLHALLN